MRFSNISKFALMIVSLFSLLGFSGCGGRNVSSSVFAGMAENPTKTFQGIDFWVSNAIFEETDTGQYFVSPTDTFRAMNRNTVYMTLRCTHTFTDGTVIKKDYKIDKGDMITIRIQAPTKFTID